MTAAVQMPELLRLGERRADGGSPHAVVGRGARSIVYGIGVGTLADGSAVPMAAAIASAGLAAVVAFALLRRRGGAATPAPPGGGAGSEVPK